ncbi:MAG: M1 family metallopeptidase, partial [Cyanobacteria bacterium P01_A01_bin.135]
MGHHYRDERRPFELAGAAPHYTPDRPGQVKHIALDLSLDIPQRRYDGRCTILLEPVREGIGQLALDAVNLTIESVTVEGMEQRFDYDGEQLQIHLDETPELGRPISVAIAYSVDQPQRGLYFIGPDEHYPYKPVQVWTQGEDEDSRYWFPCFDYPGQLASSEIRVRIPSNLMAISNGRLVSVAAADNDTGDGQDSDSKSEKIYHWRQDEVHPTYLMTLAVGDFAELQDQWQGKPVTYYVEKGREEDARRTMGKTPAMVDFLSRAYGYPYPFPKYAQVCVDDFIFGGMENTSTTLLTDRCLLDERAALDNRRAESLVVHELAHQWFGDLVVIKHWSHAWIKEGMASYSEVMWTEREYGLEEAAYYRLQEARSYIDEDSSRYRRPMVTHVYREAIELYDSHIYEKGACVYHMIRAELGDALFERAMHQFVQDNAHRTVETVDLLRAIDKATGRNLQFLFDQYVFRGGYPSYKVAYRWDGDGQMATLTVTQTQAKSEGDDHKGLFDLKIPVGFATLSDSGADKDADNASDNGANKDLEMTTVTVRIHQREQTFYFPLPQKPAFVSFDIGNAYLKTVALEMPLAELAAQLTHDPDPVARIHAAKAIAKKGGLEAVRVLAKALKDDGFWGVRAEVAKQLAKVKLDQATEALLTGLEDDEARVRRAVVQSLSKIKTKTVYKALKAIAQAGDPSYYVEAAALQSLASVITGSELTSKQEKVIKLLETVLEKRAGWNEVVRAGAIAGLSKLNTSPEALALILNYTALGVPQPLRLSAIRALGPASTGQSKPDVEQVLSRLEEISAETFFLTQVAVVSALSKMETPKAIAVLDPLASQSSDGRVRRRAEEAIEVVRKHTASDKSVAELRKALDQ